MDQTTRFIGMDVHKVTITVAVTAVAEAGKATPYWTIRTTERKCWSTNCGRLEAGRWSSAMRQVPVATGASHADPAWRGVHGGGAFNDPSQKRGATKERQARRRQPSGAAPGRGARSGFPMPRMKRCAS